MRETLEGYDFARDIKEEFNHALAESKVDGMKNLKILREEPQGFRVAYIKQSTADAVMFIDVKYAFTPSFDALDLTSRVMIFPINPALSPYKEKPDNDNYIEYEDNIYRNQFTVIVPVGTIDGKTSENAAIWAEMSDEKLSGLIQKAAEQMAEYVAYDLSIDDVPEEPEVENENSEAETSDEAEDEAIDG